MNEGIDVLSRREALRRVAFLLGGAVSAPTLAGVLAGCERPREPAVLRPRTLTGAQSEMITTMGEIILPETETPGARAARVHEFIDVMLTEYYPPEERQRFLAGLERVDAYSLSAFDEPFLTVASEQQLQLVHALNRQAFSEASSGGLVLDPDRHPQDTGEDAFFRTFKELVLVGYYTSEPGSSLELRVNPMGPWRADIPYSEVGRAWSS
jgi:gluconate 2-dehydrogenase gamma chain